MQLQRLAASEHIGVEEKVQALFTEDIVRLRFLEAAGTFAEEHAAAFAARFGAGHSSGRAV
ncbi:hypothetical protein ACFQVC_32890 [Streptomyces monticola]|uniref:Uncharacterized protein n=1 Tax=Streptomyces monticola TaxID=2666263 RepID=A0ABW2JTL8_9ACTN